MHSKKIQYIILTFIFLFILSSIIFAVIPLDTEIDREITTLIQSREYNTAIERINDNFNQLSPKDYYLYTLGNLYSIIEQYNNSIDALERLTTEYPDSKYYHKAMLKKVEVLFAQGEQKDAYTLYKKELDYLLSSDRRYNIAKVYVELGKELSSETEDYIPSNTHLRTAIELYNMAMEIGLPDDIADEIAYDIAYSTYKINSSNMNAVNLFDKVINEFPESEYVDEAIFYAAKIYFSNNRYEDARNYFTKLYEDYPDSEFAPQSIYEKARTYGLYNPQSIRNLEIIADLIQRLIDEYPYPGSDYSKYGLYDLAAAYSIYEAYKSKAIELFQQFENQYGEDEYELSSKALINTGNIYMERNDYAKAKQAYIDFIEGYPAYKEWESIQSKLIYIDYLQAYNSYVAGDYQQAINGFNRFMDDYPLDSRNASIMYMIGDIHYKQESWEEAIDQWKKVVSKYPGTTNAAKSQYYIGLTLEMELNRLEEAKEAYEKVSGDYNWVSMANERINLLTSLVIDLSSDKVFTTNDEPYVSLGLRNIEKVTMKVYNLDLKEYFISKKTIRKIEDLDIILIKPDHEFEINFGEEIPDSYEDFRHFQTDIPLPVNDPGSYVVYVESDTFKSTVLFLISDIAMTVKSTKDSALIHMKSLTTEQSRGGVNLMVTSGNQIIAEDVTGDNGMIDLDLKKLREEGYSTNNLRYFAYQDKHYTSTDLYTGSVYTPSQTQSTGYIFTDKDKYKPGDTIHYKAILRKIEQGVVEALDNESYTVTLSTSQEGQIYKESMTLTDYGTLFGGIELPESLSTSSSNTATLTITGEDYSFYKRNIDITLFKPAERELTITFDEPAYKLGETMRVTITGSYLSGAPTSNAVIQYFITGENWQKAELDDNGKLELTIYSSLYPDREFINVQAYFTDDPSSVRYSETGMIILKDFSISFYTTSAVYLPSETAEVTINTEDYSGQLISKQLDIRLSRTDEETGLTDAVMEETINTDQNGSYTFTYTDDIGGSYTLTAEGTGDNGLPVSSSVGFRIIPSEGGSPIEILPEGLEFKVGETKPVKVFSKVEGGLALFTVERAKILEHRLVRLSEGVNNIEVSVDETYAPNSALSVSLVKQDGFYYSTRDIEVASGIEIGIKTDSEEYLPAGEVSLSINTKDVYGNPLQSEVMVAVVDEAVLQATNTTYAEIKDVFYKMLTLQYVTQTGSTPFTYYGIQDNIDEDLLAERERRDYEETEEEVDEDDFYAMEEDPAEESFRTDDMSDEMDNGAMGGLADDGMKREKAEEEQRKYKPSDISSTVTMQDTEQKEAALRKLLKDTAFFKPDLITDNEGNVEVSFTLPDNLTRWKVFTIANNDRSLFGMNSKTIVSTRDLVVKIDAPLEMTEGDTFSFNVSLQNNTSDMISESLDIAMLQDDEVISEQSEEFDIRGKSSKALPTNRYTTPRNDFKLRASTIIDGEERDIKTRNWETTNRKGVQGFTDRTVFRYIELNEDIMNNTIDKRIKVRIMPNTSEVLYQIKDRDYPYIFGAESIVQNTITSLSLYKYLLSSDSGNTTAINELEKEIKSNITILELWNKNGLWNYYNNPYNTTGDYNITAMAYYALTMAEKEEFTVNERIINQSAEKLLTYYRTLDDEDTEQKALIAFALSNNKKIDYNRVNNLFNSRNSLSMRGLSLLSIALFNLDQRGDAKVVNDMLVNTISDGEALWPVRLIYPDYLSDPYATKALALYAVLQTEPLDKTIEDHVNTVISHLQDPYIVPNYLTFASMMYQRYLFKKGETGMDFLLTVLINEEQLYRERMNNLSDVLELTTTDVIQENKIEINIQGDMGKLIYEVFAEYTYDEEIAENENNEDENLTKFYHYPDYRLDVDEVELQALINSQQQDYSDKGYKQLNNKAMNQMEQQQMNVANLQQQQTFINDLSYQISKNYNILTDNQPESNQQYLNQFGNYDIIQEISEVPKGEEIPVSLTVDFTDEEQSYDYYIVEDYIPAGFILDDGSISGVNAYRQQGNKLIFYLKRNNNYAKTIRYRIRAQYEGTYRTLPPKYYKSRFRNREVIEETDQLEVRSEDYDIFTNYQLSPYELYPIGMLYFQLEKYDEAEKFLEDLFNNWSLKPTYRKDVVEALFKINLVNGDKPNKIISFYEILRDEFPSTQISLDHIKQVAEAYETIGEGEKAYYLIQTLFRSYFGQEYQLPIILLDRMKYKSSYDTAINLFMDYPDLPVTRNGLYSYTNVLYSAMNQLGQYDRQKLDDGTLLKKFYYTKAYDLITAYLTYYPDTFNTDEVSFLMMNLFFDTERYQSAYNSGELFIKRYPDSQFLDDYLYLTALARFSNNEIDKAMPYLEKVAYDKFPNEDGIMRNSPNRLYALRLIAQSMHAKGEVEEAIKIYKEIRNNFKDAENSIQILEEKVMEIDDVVTSGVDEETELSIKHKNIDKVTAKIYSVDFVILALTEKDLSDVTKINLSGIKPMIEQEYTLNYEESYLPSETTIELPIQEMGAYLAVIRSDVGERSAIIIKSELDMDVYESKDGRVRVMVTDENNDFVSGMKMYFIGSENDSFKVTETDLRGMAEVYAIYGTVTIIGNKDGEYVFYRSDEFLNGYYYGQDSINNLLEVNSQRESINQKNIILLQSIIQAYPKSISIGDIYQDSTNQ
jgi:uncharacterized protein YfaS (alpha-2-macroglobulin family)/TolA-binding protein